MIECFECGNEVLPPRRKFCSDRCNFNYHNREFYRRNKDDKDFYEARKANADRWIKNNKSRHKELIRKSLANFRARNYPIWRAKGLCYQCHNQCDKKNSKEFYRYCKECRDKRQLSKEKSRSKRSDNAAKATNK